MFTILFLCTGNTCRSPMAEYLCKKMIRDHQLENIKVYSAGIASIPGLNANPWTREALQEEGIEINDFYTEQINKKLVDDADLILVMTADHKQSLQQMGYNSEGKVFTLKEYAGYEDDIDISDPYGSSLEVYRDIKEEIKKILHKVLVKIKDKHYKEGKSKIVQNNIKEMNLNKMKIAIGSDHAGIELKQKVIDLLDENDISCSDMGTNTAESVDYPDFAHKVTKAVVEGDCDRGILICGTGIGMSIAANKTKGIRAALCHDVFSARATREHNNSNVLTFGARVIGSDLALEIVKTWLNTDFSEAARHQRRIDKITAMEGENA